MISIYIEKSLYNFQISPTAGFMKWGVPILRYSIAKERLVMYNFTKPRVTRQYYQIICPCTVYISISPCQPSNDHADQRQLYNIPCKEELQICQVDGNDCRLYYVTQVRVTRHYYQIIRLEECKAVSYLVSTRMISTCNKQSFHNG